MPTPLRLPRSASPPTELCDHLHYFPRAVTRCGLPPQPPPRAAVLHSPAFQRAICHLRYCEKLTLARVRAELINQFGIRISLASVCKALRKAVGGPAKPKPSPPVFDAWLESAGPIRIRVVRGRARLVVAKPGHRRNRNAATTRPSSA